MAAFFVFKQAVFEYIQDGEELVETPFNRMIEQQQLISYPYDGFWACMDTLKDKQAFDVMAASKENYWRVWRS